MPIPAGPRPLARQLDRRSKRFCFILRPGWLGSAYGGEPVFLPDWRRICVTRREMDMKTRPIQPNPVEAVTGWMRITRVSW